ncbi:hypothetical protein X975_06956, partial [Stegodyphus mimosarum]
MRTANFRLSFRGILITSSGLLASVTLVSSIFSIAILADIAKELLYGDKLWNYRYLRIHNAVNRTLANNHVRHFH